MSNPLKSEGWRSFRRKVKDSLPQRPYYLATTAARTAQHIPTDLAYRSTAAKDGLSTPLPPPYLRYRVSGSYSVSDFHVSGRDGRSAFEDALRSIDRQMSEFDSVLDFGVGCARILRWMESLSEQAFFAGSDIDEWAVSWCQRNVPFAVCKTNDGLPPLKFADESFDLVYSHSVFTHLDQEYQAAWLEELRRVLRPDGVALLTVHGDSAFENYVKFAPHDKARGAEVRATWEQAGFYFNNQSQWRGVFPDYYHNSYQSLGYTNEVWNAVMPVLKYLPGGMRSSQDIVVLRKP